MRGKSNTNRTQFSHLNTYQELLNFKNLNPDESDFCELRAWLADLLLKSYVGQRDDATKFLFRLALTCIGIDDCSKGNTYKVRDTKTLAIVVVDCGT